MLAKKGGVECTVYSQSSRASVSGKALSPVLPIRESFAANDESCFANKRAQQECFLVFPLLVSRDIGSASRSFRHHHCHHHRRHMGPCASHRLLQQYCWLRR